jgi:predicted RNase H-like HicB family nuclease
LEIPCSILDIQERSRGGAESAKAEIFHSMWVSCLPAKMRIAGKRFDVPPPGGYLGFMNSSLTAVFLQFPEGYAAFVEELPGANTQGATLDEARANLIEAVAMVLAANRELAEEELRGHNVIRESFPLPAA